MTIATMPERAAGRKLGDVRAVAEKLDCSPRHIYRMADAGRMPAPLRLASLVRWDLEKIDRGWPWRSWKKVRSTRGWRRKTLTGKLSAALPPYLRRCRFRAFGRGADRLGRRAGAGCRGAGRRSTSGAGAAMAIGAGAESRTRRDCRGCGRFLGWGKWYEDRGNR